MPELTYLLSKPPGLFSASPRSSLVCQSYGGAMVEGDLSLSLILDVYNLRVWVYLLCKIP